MSETTKRLLDLATAIQQIPAPTFGEGQRAELVLQAFAAEDLRDVSLDSLHNVYARFPGKSRENPLIVSAHLDTVFAADTAGTTSRDGDRLYGAGIGDNALGVAALLGLVWMLRKARVELSSDLWLAANVCEEGLGNLRGMREVVSRFGADVRGYLVIEGTALGHVYHRAVGARRYRVSLHTSGGHSWSDYGQPSAIHEMARLMTNITAVPLPERPRTTLNIGVASGGTGVNVLAADARFELDVRSEDVETLRALTRQVESIVRAAERPGVSVDMEVIGERPAGQIPADHPLVSQAEACLAEQGLKAVLMSGSTDANVPLSLGYPSIVLGITSGGGAHTSHEYIDMPPVEQGMRQLARFVERVLGSSEATGSSSR